MNAHTQNNWEVYANIRQDALAFLDARMLVPDTMYISEDGWVEAVYSYPTNTGDTLNRWQAIRDSQEIKISDSDFEVEEKLGTSTLRVNFNLYQDQKGGLWGRIKQLVS